MQIGELARISGVSPSRIRFYEARGLLPIPQRRENGYRDYQPSMISTLRFVEDAQSLGFSLREIGSGISSEGDVTSDLDLILPALERKLGDLEAHISASQALRARLVALIAEQREACKTSSGAKGLAPDK